MGASSCRLALLRTHYILGEELLFLGYDFEGVEDGVCAGYYFDGADVVNEGFVFVFLVETGRHEVAFEDEAGDVITGELVDGNSREWLG